MFLFKVQLEAGNDAWCKEFRDGSLCELILLLRKAFVLKIPGQATSKDGKEGGIELIQPPANAKPGDRVYFEGEGFESRFSNHGGEGNSEFIS